MLRLKISSTWMDGRRILRMERYYRKKWLLYWRNFICADLTKYLEINKLPIYFSRRIHVPLIWYINILNTQSSTLYIYYIYIELAYTQSPFLQNLPYECTASVPDINKFLHLSLRGCPDQTVGYFFKISIALVR